MRNDNDRWQAPSTVAPDFAVEGIQVSTVQVERQTLISGPIGAALGLSGLDVAIGWPDIAKGNSYALRLRRDRILAVNGAELPDGWDDAKGLGVSDMTGGYCTFEIKGPRALDLIKRGAGITRRHRSASVARNFAGFGSFIYFHGDQTCIRLHVTRSYGQVILQKLASMAGEM